MPDWKNIVLPTPTADPEPVSVDRLAGMPLDVQEDYKNAEANNLSFLDTAYKSFTSGGNYAYQIGNAVMRKIESGPEDANWDSRAWLDTKPDIPREQRYKFNLTDNQKEAEIMYADMLDNRKNVEILSRQHGMGSFAAQTLAGIIDVDAPISIATGGLTAAATRGIAMTKFGRIGLPALAGGVTAGGGALAAQNANPNQSWAEVPIAALAGSAFGIGGGMLGGLEHKANVARTNALNELGESLDTPYVNLPEDNAQMFTYPRERVTDTPDLTEAAETGPAPVVTAPTAPDIQFNPSRGWVETGANPDAGSAGARTMPNAALTGPISSPQSRQIILDSQRKADQLDLELEWSQRNAPKGYTGVARNAKEAAYKAGNKFYDAYNKSYFASDFSRLFNSPSVSAKVLAYEIFSNAAGIVVNARNSGNIMDTELKQMLGRMQPYRAAQNEYMSIAKSSKSGLKEADFEKEVWLEMAARYHDGAGYTRPADSAITKAADALDDVFAYELDMIGGKRHHDSWIGMDTVQKQTGYMPQRVGSRNISNLTRSMGRTIDEVTDAYAEGLRSVHPYMSVKDSKVYARAVIDRAQNSGQGMTNNLAGVLQNDGRKALEQLLQRNGIPQPQITRLIDGLTTNLKEKSKPGYAKQRMDIDPRFVATNGIKMIDLFDTAISDMVERRARQSAGKAGLVRGAGIASRADWDARVQAILDEQQARAVQPVKGPQSVGDVARAANDFLDSENMITKQYMDNIYDYFANGVMTPMNPMVSGILKLTTLSLLNQRALTDAAELGPMMAGIGFQRFMQMLPAAYRKDMMKSGHPVMDELAHIYGFVPEDRMFMYIGAELDRFDPHQSMMGQRINSLLNKGLRLQSAITLANTVRDISQRMAMTTAWDRVMRHVRDGQGMSSARLRDMGFTQKHLNEFKALIDNNVIEFDAEGYLYKLNLDKWGDERLVDDVLYNTTRIVNQYVQRAQAGETNMLFHRDGISALMMQFKGFPMLAMEKQAIRNMRIADAESWGQLWYGMAAAGMSYSARQVINNRTENLTPEKIAAGAFNISSMAGWIPMWVDPLAVMLGLEKYSFGGGRYNQTALALPASWNVMNDLIEAPASAVKVLSGEYTNSDINNISRLPLFGNYYGIAGALNTMKD